MARFTIRDRSLLIDGKEYAEHVYDWQLVKVGEGEFQEWAVRVDFCVESLDHDINGAVLSIKGDDR